MPLATVRPDGEGHRIIVVSQDCDAVQGDCELEPGIEVVVATPLSQVVKKHQHLRDPRALHLELRGTGSERYPVAITPWAKGVVARPTLLAYRPNPELRLRDVDIQDIADFLARRYDRDALPEEFERRFVIGMDKLKTLFRANPDVILQIYLKVTPSEELAPFQPDADDEDQPRYEATVVVLVTDTLLDNKAEMAAFRDSKIPDLKRALRKGCPGVDVEDVILYGSDSLSVKRARDLRRVDLASERSIIAGRRADQAEATEARAARRADGPDGPLAEGRDQGERRPTAA
ncbi:hypothetical protein tb265_06880 [Gemmatimonadetes bacterium T265]|nr:hypothetical protein tb265_06880 [Gemmatimonadetes bacterium T265]